MLSANTIEILKKLDKKELRRLGEFIKSPYFNSIERLGDLYDEVAKAYPGFPAAKLDVKYISRKLYPGKELSDKTVKNLYSEFGKILKSFLAYEEIRKDEDTVNQYLVRALSEKGFHEMSNKIISERMERGVKRSTEDYYYWHDYKLGVQYYKNLFNKSKLNLQEIFDAQSSMAESLIAYFISTFSNIAYNRVWSLKVQNVQNKDSELEKFLEFFNSEKLLDYLNSPKHRNSVSIKIDYLLFYYTMNGFTEKEYYELKEMLLNNIDTFTKTDILNYWTSIIATMLVELEPLSKELYRELFELGSFFSSREIYPDKYLEEFPVSLLRNTITIALILEEYEWAENFLDKYCKFVNPKLRENEINYSKGILSFKHGKYEESLEYLSRVNFTDVYENLNIRFYLLMNHIELKHYESALSMINSINQFYKSSKDIPEFARNLIKASLKYLSEVIKSEESGSWLDYSIYKEAKETGRFYHKKYILGKLKKMIKDESKH